ncbi:NUDIX domain-containing protein [Streptomyces sp. NBC_01180]|uniref:NUDIX domain-containing protein n=1 Tax=Streptomyces sp. NBC_01180 TaxID=2903763 RepID=UPI0038683E47|nr:NUDIX domain-containing protein [Streptomyces sp. NBC_01180]
MGELVERVGEQDRVLAVVDRAEAIREGRLHRVATIVRRDSDGRILVHRRPGHASRFPGQLNWMLGGAVGVGESYEAAAARELAEELGVRAAPRLMLKFLCSGVISPYWLGLHEAVVTTPARPDAREVAGHHWVTEPELANLVRREDFVPDAREAYDRHRAAGATPPLHDGVWGWSV